MAKPQCLIDVRCESCGAPVGVVSRFTADQGPAPDGTLWLQWTERRIGGAGWDESVPPPGGEGGRLTTRHRVGAILDPANDQEPPVKAEYVACPKCGRRLVWSPLEQSVRDAVEHLDAGRRWVLRLPELTM